MAFIEARAEVRPHRPHGHGPHPALYRLKPPGRVLVIPRGWAMIPVVVVTPPPPPPPQSVPTLEDPSIEGFASLTIDGSVQRRRRPAGDYDRIYVSDRGVRTLVLSDDHLAELEQQDLDIARTLGRGPLALAPDTLDPGGTQVRLRLPGGTLGARVRTRFSLLPPGVFQQIVLPGAGYTEHYLRRVAYLIETQEPVVSEYVRPMDPVTIEAVAFDFRSSTLYMFMQTPVMASQSLHVITRVNELLAWLRHGAVESQPLLPRRVLFRDVARDIPAALKQDVPRTTFREIFAVQTATSDQSGVYVQAPVYKRHGGAARNHVRGLAIGRGDVSVWDNNSTTTYPLLGEQLATTRRLLEVLYYDANPHSGDDVFIYSRDDRDVAPRLMHYWLARTGAFRNRLTTDPTNRVTRIIVQGRPIGLKVDSGNGEVYFVEVHGDRATGQLLYRAHVFDGTLLRPLRVYEFGRHTDEQQVIGFDVRRGVLAMLHQTGEVDFRNSQTGVLLSTHRLARQQTCTCIAFISDDQDVAIGTLANGFVLLVRSVRSALDVQAAIC